MRSQIGFAAETTYGTYQAPTRFLEFLNETLNREKRTIESNGIRAQTRRGLRRSQRRVVTGRSGTGRVNLEFPFDGSGLLLENMLGDADTTTPNGATDAREHVFTLDSLWDKSLTIQKGVERDDETVIPYSFVGSKITSWELAVGVDEFLTLGLDIDSRDVLTDEPLEEADFDDGNLAHFMQASLRLDDVLVAEVTRAQITGTNPMKLDRYFLGSAGLKAQQKSEGYPTVGGQLDADFVDEATLVEAYHTDQPLSLELRLVGEEIEDGFDEELTIDIADIRLDGQTPQVSGPEIPTLTIPFSGYDDGVSEGIQVLLRNADETP